MSAKNNAELVRHSEGHMWGLKAPFQGAIDCTTSERIRLASNPPAEVEIDVRLFRRLNLLEWTKPPKPKTDAPEYREHPLGEAARKAAEQNSGKDRSGKGRSGKGHRHKQDIAHRLKLYRKKPSEERKRIREAAFGDHRKRETTCFYFYDGPKIANALQDCGGFGRKLREKSLARMLKDPKPPKPFCHFEWDETTGLGVSLWVPHGPCIVMGLDDKGKEYRRGPDLSKYLWEHDPPRPESLLVPPDRDQADCVDIGGYEHGRGYKVWHVPDAVEEYPARAKREAKSARAVLRSRTEAAKRGVVWLGTERLGRPKRLADKYEFWVQPTNSGAWIPGSLFVVVCGGDGHPVFRSVVQRDNRKITQQNKKRSPNEQKPLLVAFEATPSDFDPTRCRIRFTGKPSEHGGRVEGYPKVRPDHTDEYRKTFLDLFKEWKQKRWDKEKKRWYNPPLELGPPVVTTNAFDTDPKLAMFWTETLDATESPKLDLNWQWRRAGIREAIVDPARQSKRITRKRKRYINREHYLNGLMVLTRHLILPPPITWRTSVDVMSHSGQAIKRAGERFDLGSVRAEDAARVIARQRARKRQIEAAYTLAGYVSSTTGRRRRELEEVLKSVKRYYKDYVYKGNEDPFRAALNMELPGAVYVAAFDGRAADRESGREEEEDGDVILGRYARSQKNYNEQLRKLGYREYKDGEGWTAFPVDKPLPKPLETEIRVLARDAVSHVLYANRRRDFGDVWKVRDGDERRKLLPDTRSDGTDPDNGYQNSKDWQEYDSGHEPNPAEYDIEVAVAEGDVLVAGSSQADPELNPDLEEKLRNEAISEEDTLALLADEPEDVDWEAEDASLTPDFDTHHGLNFKVDEKGEKHLVRLEFAQSEAIEGFREFARNYDPEKYATAYEQGMLPEFERQQLYPSYREAVLLDLLGERRVPGIGEEGGTFVRYEDEETGERRTVKASKLADLIHELDGEGPSRFGLTEREREIFGCYYGTDEMTVEDIRERVHISKSTYQRDIRAVRDRMARAGIQLPAQAERRGRRAA